MLEAPGKRNKNANCKRLSRTPAVTTQPTAPTLRSKKRARYKELQRAKAKQVEAIKHTGDFDRQQKIAKQGGQPKNASKIEYRVLGNAERKRGKPCLDNPTGPRKVLETVFPDILKLGLTPTVEANLGLLHIW